MFNAFNPIDTTEIRRLADMLDRNNIPFDTETLFGGMHIAYPKFATDDEPCVCSVILHNGSYGREVGLLEIMGLLTKEERKHDEVVGFLTAEDVFERIKKHWDSVQKG